MALEDLLADGVVVADHTGVDLAAAREVTYLFHNEVVYEYPAPIRSLRHQFVVLPRHRHGDQRRLTHRVHVDVPHQAVVRRRYDRFGNPVVEVRSPRVGERFSIDARAVLHRSRDDVGTRPWRDTHTMPTGLTAAMLRSVRWRGASTRAGGTTGRRWPPPSARRCARR